MAKNQHTLKKTYCFEGKGLHTGTFSHMKVMPAPADSGIAYSDPLTLKRAIRGRIGV